MGKALPFPMHKHPPTKTNILGDVGAAASVATSAAGEDQGEAGPGAEAGDEAIDSEKGMTGGRRPGGANPHQASGKSGGGKKPLE